ncbi:MULTISPECIES: NAD(P)-binding oxidoreductase [unclassified Exiguobacterium]|uniref:NAD(P)-binding oxidoreductase n=1 Tax=unclassified Exiguobacterium TaxID=2644629 RepID=UPI0008AAAB0E|nr:MULTISPECIES: NAD(P)-binding oxidoreductase [unclassified Exiguobacterium]OGX78575.1 NmrA family transcriptional regulator [Exiguobacterium sp. SH31]TCI35109.1 NAD(P)-dependent oxidoreductase [Exiguobacterium sp. SH4S7]TCI44655.1 NAD(P)-dependent oxidoreductase [Exiguobacterium sp. SH5S32]TCI51062.1 NAD(P)-dependent oxidoreductase [Exiguobacterium sp. SH1S4]TCI59804.1 NAD(P)-dependent oxidoreductase [Exiguobacterium sp. SH0S2]
MKVLVIGATGKIGRRVLKSLAKTHQVTALIRYPELQAEYEKMGARVLTVDVEKELDKKIHEATAGQDAVIVAATAGAEGTSKEIELLDRNVAMKAIDAAKKERVRHVVLLSAYGADRPDAGPKEHYNFLSANNAADEYIEHSGLNYTIICPVAIIDGPGKGSIEASEDLSDASGATISETDVATVIAASLDNRGLYGRRIEIRSGSTPINDALDFDSRGEAATAGRTTLRRPQR